MRVLVCGGRDYWNYHQSRSVLDEIDAQSRITTIIEGGGTGADKLGRQWALFRDRGRERFPANWTLGKHAGPLRNQRMIDEGKPDLVVAFPGGKGTADMVRRAKAAGVKVVEVSP